MQSACLNCGKAPTIKAHLIPRVFCREVQKGKSHAANVLANGSFVVSQSGMWDAKILCGTCDKHIGCLEEYAHKVFSAVRTNGSHEIGSSKIIDNANPEKLLRFAAALLYKYSITTPEKGQIDLGPYQQVCREMAFTECAIPPEVDGFALRLVRKSGDSGVFAYRAPTPDDSHGVGMFRFMVGGMLIFVKLDEKPLPTTKLTPYSMRDSVGFVYIVAPATTFEEFYIPKDWVKSNSRLSDFLEKTTVKNREKEANSD